MHYLKVKTGDIIIELHNSNFGKETVVVDGVVVSEKSSLIGTNHFFSINKEGVEYRYMLTTRIAGMFTVVADILKDGEFIITGAPLRWSKTSTESNKFKKEGIRKLDEFELEDAIVSFNKALDIEPENAEVHFYLACIHSLMEKKELGFFHLEKSIEYHLVNRTEILKNDYLAYLRIQPEFEEFRTKHLDYDVHGENI
jgi:hypothetical protein